MGFFSFECKGCGHSILSPYSVDKENKWMKDCVAIDEDGCILKGEYDGYGRIGPYEDGDYEDKAFYHQHCWELLGKPTEFDGVSGHAADQGYFFDIDTHNIPKFETVEEMQYEKKRIAFQQKVKHDYYQARDKRHKEIDESPESAIVKVRFTQEVTFKHQAYCDGENIARNVAISLEPTTNDTINDYGERKFEVLEETPPDYEKIA